MYREQTGFGIGMYKPPAVKARDLLPDAQWVLGQITRLGKSQFTSKDLPAAKRRANGHWTLPSRWEKGMRQLVKAGVVYQRGFSNDETGYVYRIAPGRKSIKGAGDPFSRRPTSGTTAPERRRAAAEAREKKKKAEEAARRKKEKAAQEKKEAAARARRQKKAKTLVARSSKMVNSLRPYINSTNAAISLAKDLGGLNPRLDQALGDLKRLASAFSNWQDALNTAANLSASSIKSYSGCDAFLGTQFTGFPVDYVPVLQHNEDPVKLFGFRRKKEEKPKKVQISASQYKELEKLADTVEKFRQKYPTRLISSSEKLAEQFEEIDAGISRRITRATGIVAKAQRDMDSLSGVLDLSIRILRKFVA